MKTLIRYIVQRIRYIGGVKYGFTGQLKYSPALYWRDITRYTRTPFSREGWGDVRILVPIQKYMVK